MSELLDQYEALVRGEGQQPVPGSVFGVAITEVRLLRARLGAIAQAHREPPGAAQLRAEALGDASPKPRRVEHDDVAGVLRALDGVTKNRIGSGVGVIDALRSAAAREGIRVDGLTDDQLVEACRAHVAAPPADALGLGMGPGVRP
jgi:hypothetical protein